MNSWWTDMLRHTEEEEEEEEKKDLTGDFCLKIIYMGIAMFFSTTGEKL